MQTLDIVFNIDYASDIDVGPLFADIPEYIQFLQVNDFRQFKRLISLLSDDIQCFIWLHPSYSSTRVKEGVSSHVVKAQYILDRLGIEYTIITRSAGRTTDRDVHAVDSMLDLKKLKSHYKPTEILTIINDNPEILQSKQEGESKTMKILYLASSPEDQDTLNPGIEERLIDETLAMSSRRESFELIVKHGSKLETLSKALMEKKPDFVHFTGHGGADSLVMERDDGTTHSVPGDTLQLLFKTAKENVQCIFLSACYSAVQAMSISKNGIYVIGMNDSVYDDEATFFAKGFYQAIGEGVEIERAFKMGQVHYFAHCSKKDKRIPELWFNGQKISELE